MNELRAEYELLTENGVPVVKKKRGTKALDPDYTTPVGEIVVVETESGPQLVIQDIPLPSSAYKRHPMDHYVTPSKLARAALQLATLRGATAPRILDPGAGTGIWGAAARARWPESFITGVELDEQHRWHRSYDQWVQADYLKWDNSTAYNLIIGNPPYSKCEDFVRMAMTHLTYSGQMMLVLPINFLASQVREAGLFQIYLPNEQWVCSKRPSFTANGRTDAREYALYIWYGGIDREENPDCTRSYPWRWDK